MVIFKKLRYKNFLSTGNNFTEIDFVGANRTLIIGVNGSGKCLRKSTAVDIQFKSDAASMAYSKFMTARDRKYLRNKQNWEKMHNTPYKPQ